MSLARTMKEPGLVWVWGGGRVADFLEVTSSLLFLSFALRAPQLRPAFKVLLWPSSSGKRAWPLWQKWEWSG